MLIRVVVCVIARVPAVGAGELLVLLLQEYATGHKIVVTLDECQSMSEPDWAATYEVCKAIKAAKIKSVLWRLERRSCVRLFVSSLPIGVSFRRNLALWMACRPLRNKRYAPRFSQIPPEYHHIMDNMATVLQLDFWQPKHTLEMISRLFRAKSSDPELVALIHERTGGHPLFCTKFASALKSVNAIIVDDGYVRFSDKAINQLDWDLDLPVPYHIQRVVASHVDILSPSQIILLKVASIICVGNSADSVAFKLDVVRSRFDLAFSFTRSADYIFHLRLWSVRFWQFWQLREIHPVPVYHATIDQDAAALEDLGFLTRVKSEFKRTNRDEFEEKFDAGSHTPPYPTSNTSAATATTTTATGSSAANVSSVSSSNVSAATANTLPRASQVRT